MQADLTKNISRKLLLLIDNAEKHALLTGISLEAKLYLQLADLYHFHQMYAEEIAILKRFSQFEQADGLELVDVFARIEHLTSLQQHSLSSPKKHQTSIDKLALLEEQEDDNPISLASNKDVKRRIHEDKQAYHQQKLKVATVSAAYTGVSDKDQIVQVAIVLYEFDPSQELKAIPNASYWGKCNTRKPPPDNLVKQFGLDSPTSEAIPFKAAEAYELLRQADFIVSHNDAEVERKLLTVLIPEIISIDWYSSERDIPWRALGFSSNRLNIIVSELHEKPVKTCLQRANFIGRLLTLQEQSSQHNYLERLYNMQPMKPMQWSSQLKQNSVISNKWFRWLFISIMSLVVLGIGYSVF